MKVLSAEGSRTSACWVPIRSARSLDGIYLLNESSDFLVLVEFLISFADGLDVDARQRLGENLYRGLDGFPGPLASLRVRSRRLVPDYSPCVVLCLPTIYCARITAHSETIPEFCVPTEISKAVLNLLPANSISPAS